MVAEKMTIPSTFMPLLVLGTILYLTSGAGVISRKTGVYLMRSSRASAEVITGPVLEWWPSFSEPVPGWMMSTSTMPTMTAMKVVHR
ncbi:hypothetical protein EYF80_011526 [Liparis tanakae]|uniref:Uncharacterized protein n=1 Tax=Liparis tanakae TaxID=230148 RepID=A0A4Z2IK88_9TELE|nr:hypothetical protein EYF80_011526 [Liparis tanakae]